MGKRERTAQKRRPLTLPHLWPRWPEAAGHFLDLLSPDKLSAAVDAAGAEAREARSRYDAAAAKVTDKKAMLKAMDNYRNTDPVIKEYRMIRKEKDKQKFYAAHEADFIINDAAKHQLDKLGVPK